MVMMVYRCLGKKSSCRLKLLQYLPVTENGHQELISKLNLDFFYTERPPANITMLPWITEMWKLLCRFESDEIVLRPLVSAKCTIW